MARCNSRTPTPAAPSARPSRWRRALAGFDGWITGRKRFQSRTRADLDFFELEEATTRIKVNPLARWRPEDVQAYMDENRLPRHPLVAQGYPSIGCAPCTSRVTTGEDPRAGRWRGQDKTECGIHFVEAASPSGPTRRVSIVTAPGLIATKGPAHAHRTDTGFSPDDFAGRKPRSCLRYRSRQRSGGRMRR